MAGKWYVLYKIPEMTGDQIHKAGPYKDEFEASDHRADIKGFEGVTDVRLDVDWTADGVTTGT